MAGSLEDRFPPRIGTVSESIEAVKLCKTNGWGVMCSHRSGETEDGSPASQFQQASSASWVVALFVVAATHMNCLSQPPRIHGPGAKSGPKTGPKLAPKRGFLLLLKRKR